MRQESKLFLEQLLSTASPSGDEVAIQKLWMNYVKDFAQDIKTDMIGNVIASVNPDKPFKVLLAGHADEIAFMVTHIDSDGYIYVTKAGGIDPKLALGTRVRILGSNGIVKGVVGVKAQHQGGAGDKVKFKDLFIDCGVSSKDDLEDKVQVGDYIIYDVDYEYMLNDNLTGRALDNRTGAFIVAEVLRRVADKNPNVGVFAASTVNEETNMGGAYFAASSVKPSMAIACDVTFATDYPGLDPRESGSVSLGKGPVLSKGAPINNKINKLMESAAKEHGIDLQYEVTPRVTGTDADKMRLTGEGVATALVSLPLRYMHSPSEIVNVNDIENEIELLVQTILSMTGNENLKPLE